MGDSDLVGRTVVPEQAMAEAADSPVGWSRQLSCVLQDPLKNEKNIVGENHQVPTDARSPPRSIRGAH